MTDYTLRRIVIVCDAACDIRAAVEEAASLAARSRAALHGVFLEDENLYRLAALPFGRQLTLASAAGEVLNAGDLDMLSAALGAGMERTLAKAASEHGLRWSFGVLRDLPSVAALAAIEGDLLIVQGAARPFYGSWAPRSFWSSPPEGYARPILLRRRPRTGSGKALILAREIGDAERVLRPGLAMAGPEDEVVLLLRGGPASDFAAATDMARALAGTGGRKIGVEDAAPGIPALLQAVERLKPALIVVGAAEHDGDVIRALLAATHCDLLLVP